MTSTAERNGRDDVVRQIEEPLLRVVLEALPVGVGVMDRSGDMILSNPASVWPSVRRLVSAAPSALPTLTAPAAARPALPDIARRAPSPPASASNG